MHVLDLFFGWATKQMGEALGGSLGPVRGIICDGLTIKIQVTIDIFHLLRKNIATVNSNAFNIFLEIKYEKLPVFFFNVWYNYSCY